MHYSVQDSYKSLRPYQCFTLRILSDGDEWAFDQSGFFLLICAGANSLVRSGLCEEGQLFTVELLQGFVRSIKKSDVYQPMSQIIQLLGPELGFKRQRWGNKGLSLLCIKDDVYAKCNVFFSLYKKEPVPRLTVPRSGGFGKEQH